MNSHTKIEIKIKIDKMSNYGNFIQTSKDLLAEPKKFESKNNTKIYGKIYMLILLGNRNLFKIQVQNSDNSATALEEQK